MRHQIFKSARQLAKLAGRDLIYPSLLCFRYCMTYPGTYSCPPPPLCQHRWYLTAHPWTWCWCFTDTGKAFQSLSFQHKDECFGPELLWKSARWLVSSLHLCSVCDWGNRIENIHSVFSNLLLPKGKWLVLLEPFFKIRNAYLYQFLRDSERFVYVHRCLWARKDTWPVLQFEHEAQCKFLVILKFTATLNLKNVSFHTV